MLPLHHIHVSGRREWTRVPEYRSLTSTSPPPHTLVETSGSAPGRFYFLDRPNVPPARHSGILTGLEDSCRVPGAVGRQRMATTRSRRRSMPRLSRSSRSGNSRSGSVLRTPAPEEVSRNRERLIVAVHRRDADWDGPRFEPRIHLNEDVDILALLERLDDNAVPAIAQTAPHD